MQEEWRDVVGYEGLYQVSNLGRVKSLDRVVKVKLKYSDTIIMKGKILKPYINKRHGYSYIRLSKNGVSKAVRIHRLVAEAFIPNPDNKPFVNHLDCNRSNNNLNNLEWCTPRENIIYAQKIDSTFNERNKKVIQYDKQKKIINTYESISEASRQTGISIASISFCVNGIRKHSGGYIWRFVEQ